MNRLFLPIALLIAWLIGGSFFLKNKFCGAVPAVKKSAAVIPPPASAARLLIQDVDQFKTTANNHFDFNKSTFNYLIPLADDVNTSLQQTAEYLKNNPNRSIAITGLYKAEETNGSVFPTLGIARANAVKKTLAGFGVSGKQILTKDQLLAEGLALKEGVLLDGVNFSFMETSKDLADQLAAIKQRFETNPVTLYFSTGEQNVSLSAQQRQDFSDLVFYLDNTPGSSLEVAGHTDNKGDLSMNTRLSRKRAEFVQGYLTGNGLDASRMSAKGYGPNQPISTNNTKEGRAKNRRVEVRLK